MAQTVIPHTLWSVVHVDSQETGCYNGSGSNAIDGNSSSMWVTQFCGSTPGTPHEIQINLGGSYSLSAFQYLPRQDGCANGWIKQYAFYVSTDGVNWGTAVATGTFNYGALSTTCPGGGVPAAMQVNFAPVTGQYIRLQALSEINGHPWTAVAEINVLGATVGGPLALASVSLNPAVVTGGNSSTGTVTLNGSAPAGGAVVTLSSSNTAVATVPASVTVLAGSNTATFTVMTTSVGSSTQATIGGSYNGNQSAMLTVNPGSLIPHTLWSVVYVDSQETSCYNGAGSNAIDGNSSTMWVTQFCGATPGTPHEIQINLGASYSLSAFQYLPRQDGCANGWIKQYEFYVSGDRANWGAAVATGTFNYGAVSTACPGAGVPTAFQVSFPAVTGQYVRLRALSEINGHPWTTVAELNVLGVPVAVSKLTLNPSSVVGGNSSMATVMLTGAAPLGGASVSLSSSNPSLATVPTTVIVAAGSTTATFSVGTTTAVTSSSLTVSASYGGVTQPATLIVSSSEALIAHTSWSVVYVDSQETGCYNGGGSNAIDGNSSTMWVTQFCGSTPATPHEIQINLGATYWLTAFQYLPRQDGCANGWIKQYEFYVSSDGVNWGTAVATGTFNYGTLSTACPGAGVPTAFQVWVPPVTGHYIRLRPLSEINGHPWTTVAELNVLGVPQPGLSASLASLNFGRQLVNTSTAQLIVLTNLAFSATGITAVNTSGDFAQTNDCGASLPALASCTITVTFTPTATGSRSAVLSIVNSATPPLNISLGGFGVTLHNVSLTWTASTSPVIGYFIYRGTQSGGPYTALNLTPQPQTTFIDKVAGGGATYFYVVTALGANLLESDPSQEVTATLPAF